MDDSPVFSTNLKRFIFVVDVLLLIKKRSQPTPPAMAEVSSEEKVRSTSVFFLSFEA